MNQQEMQIKRSIDETRSAMGEKIDMIANRIQNIIIGPKVAADNLVESLNEYRKAMQATTSAADNDSHPIHQAVADTIKRVQATINIIEQARQDPWIMLATAVLMGYVIGNLNRDDWFALRHAHLEGQNSRELQSPVSAALHGAP